MQPCPNRPYILALLPPTAIPCRYVRVRIGFDEICGDMALGATGILLSARSGTRGGGRGDISLDEARAAARVTGLFMLSSLRVEIGSLDKVRSVLKVFGMVNCEPGFNQTAAVIDGCSDLLVDVFGDDVGRHARSAVGMAELALDIPVEIEMVVAVNAG